MAKLGRYDATLLLEARRKISAVADFNYTSESQPLYRKLRTLINKIDKIMGTELEPKIQEEYNLTGNVN